ncbi:hypothetical protein BDP27DRAFT_28819 [Rhodocollybia butyracea]|uniref:DUF6699 domain-containing protein n=1 Tax=Rhodocollybia butyracea TaxID=206335 RepID=A0A9P5Q5E1_9AGAR|nr:hypothetical protein BDP27DRAFT_28819 [Rhodocollybia butyracea]
MVTQSSIKSTVVLLEETLDLRRLSGETLVLLLRTMPLPQLRVPLIFLILHPACHREAQPRLQLITIPCRSGLSLAIPRRSGLSFAIPGHSGMIFGGTAVLRVHHVSYNSLEIWGAFPEAKSSAPVFISSAEPESLPNQDDSSIDGDPTLSSTFTASPEILPPLPDWSPPLPASGWPGHTNNDSSRRRHSRRSRRASASPSNSDSSSSNRSSGSSVHRSTGAPTPGSSSPHHSSGSFDDNPPPPPTQPNTGADHPPPPPPRPNFVPVAAPMVPPVIHYHYMVPTPAPAPVPQAQFQIPLWPTPVAAPSILLQPVVGPPPVWEPGTFPVSRLGDAVPLRVHPNLLYNPMNPSFPVLQWDVVLRPEQARIMTGKQLVRKPSLGEEAVVSITQQELGQPSAGSGSGGEGKIKNVWIESETPILAWWMQHWGPIIIEKSEITVRDVLDAIHAYLSVPLTNGDYKRVTGVQTQTEGINFGNVMRLRSARRLRATNGCELRSVALKGRALDGWLARSMGAEPGESSIYCRSDVLGNVRRFLGVRPVVYSDGSWKLLLGLGPGPVPKFN